MSLVTLDLGCLGALGCPVLMPREAFRRPVRASVCCQRELCIFPEELSEAKRSGLDVGGQVDFFSSFAGGDHSGQRGRAQG